MILDLENHVATLTMGGADNSSMTPMATTDSNFQSLKIERDTTLEEAKITKSQILDVCTMNQVMQSKMDALQKGVVDIHQQFLVVNEVVIDYKAKIDIDVFGQLEEQNTRLEFFLLDAIVERKNIRICILFAMTKARQFEAEFESI